MKGVGKWALLTDTAEVTAPVLPPAPADDVGEPTTLMGAPVAHVVVAAETMSNGYTGHDQHQRPSKTASGTHLRCPNQRPIRTIDEVHLEASPSRQPCTVIWEAWETRGGEDVYKAVDRYVRREDAVQWEAEDVGGVGDELQVYLSRIPFLVLPCDLVGP